jgi:hypothetical protein
VKKSYRAFQKLDPEEDREEVQALVKQVCAALKAHVRLAEEIFLSRSARRASRAPFAEGARQAPGVVGAGASGPFDARRKTSTGKTVHKQGLSTLRRKPAT